MSWRIVRIAEPPPTTNMITTLDQPFVDWLLERWDKVVWFHFPSVDSYYAIFEDKIAVRWAHGIHATHLEDTVHTLAEAEYHDPDDGHPHHGPHPQLMDDQQAYPGCAVCPYPGMHDVPDPHNTPVLYHRFVADPEPEGHLTGLPGAADCDCTPCQRWSLAESLPEFNQKTIDFIEELPLLSEAGMIQVCVDLEGLPIPPYKGPTEQLGLVEPTSAAGWAGRKAAAAAD